MKDTMALNRNTEIYIKFSSVLRIEDYLMLIKIP